MKKFVVFLFALSISFLNLNSTLAAQNTITTQAKAKLNSSCLISANDLGFGNLNATSNTNATNILSITCTKSSSYSLQMSTGLNGSSTSTYQCTQSGYYYNTQGALVYGCLSSGYVTTSTVQMKGAAKGDLVPYVLYKDSARTKNWVNNSYSFSGTGSIQSINVYGSVVGGYYTPDSYSDTQTVTISY